MAFEICIVRHGIDVSGEGSAGLTPQGAARLKREARGLQWLGVSADAMLVSPDAAARQTAEILAELFTPKPTFVDVEALGIDGALEDVLLALARLTASSRIALVGHEPVVGQVAARLVGTAAPFTFKKGGACLIDAEELRPGAGCRLRWLLPPKVLREIGRRV